MLQRSRRSAPDSPVHTASTGPQGRAAQVAAVGGWPLAGTAGVELTPGEQPMVGADRRDPGVQAALKPGPPTGPDRADREKRQTAAMAADRQLAADRPWDG